ncbi:hypothetical protein G3I44_04245 [Halogeometricum borinquense]|uniref:Uncharacterized protein n=2 Tax=Halogeometricum borinquense TaxID=60847 RepID=A0A6C0ULS2_9EURY|nr:hypothetical protein G3I44_04245 [Halogeometricum borinquense]
MGEFLTRVKLGVVGTLSALIAVGAIFLGLSDIGPNLFRALVGAVVFIGYIVWEAIPSHLSSQQENILVAVVCFFGFGTVAWEVTINNEPISSSDYWVWGGLLISVLAIYGLTALMRRENM